mmetsp:Transcript_30303/g.38878  ORF Transcript_30303/g.38878 Transcript_30303/m.38878 type:complete len:88 (+) Transcript_30303:639-902(+)
MSNTNNSNAVVPPAVDDSLTGRVDVDLSANSEAGNEGFAGSISGSAVTVLTPEQKAQIDALVESVKCASRPVYFTGYWDSNVVCHAI